MPQTVYDDYYELRIYLYYKIYFLRVQLGRQLLSLYSIKKVGIEQNIKKITQFLLVNLIYLKHYLTYKVNIYEN